MLIVGLGNPGTKYAKTPHNAGFIAIDTIVKNLAPTATFSENKKLHAMISGVNYNDQKIILAKPTTFMNESGIAVRALLDYYKLPLEDLIILHDEADLPLGTFRESTDRGAAGHNGIKSIIQHLGTKNFKRIRIGINCERPEHMPLDAFVLQPMNEEQLANLQQSILQVIKYLFK